MGIWGRERKFSSIKFAFQNLKNWRENKNSSQCKRLVVANNLSFFLNNFNNFLLNNSLVASVGCAADVLSSTVNTAKVGSRSMARSLPHVIPGAVFGPFVHSVFSLWVINDMVNYINRGSLQFHELISVAAKSIHALSRHISINSPRGTVFRGKTMITWRNSFTFNWMQLINWQRLRCGSLLVVCNQSINSDRGSCFHWNDKREKEWVDKYKEKRMNLSTSTHN